MSLRAPAARSSSPSRSRSSWSAACTPRTSSTSHAAARRRPTSSCCSAPTRFAHTPPRPVPDERPGPRRRRGGRRRARARRARRARRRSSTPTATVIARSPASRRCPSTRRDRALAAARRPSALPRRHASTATPYRVLTVSRARGGAAQIARSIDGDNDVLVDRSTSACCSSRWPARCVAASLGVADRAPHRAPDRAAHATRDRAIAADPGSRPTRSTIDRHDELGRLASSFNTMLAALRHVARAAAAARDGREPRAAHAAHRAAHEHRSAAAGAIVRRRPARRAARRAPTSSSASSPTSSPSSSSSRPTPAAEEPVEPVDLGELVERVVDTAAPPHRPRDHAARAHDPARGRRPRRAARTRGLQPARQRAEVQPAGTADRGRRSRRRASRSATAAPGIARRRPPSRVRPLLPRDRPRARCPARASGSRSSSRSRELHGGTITLQARPGGGTIARLDAPPTPARSAT